MFHIRTLNKEEEERSKNMRKLHNITHKGVYMAGIVYLEALARKK